MAINKERQKNMKINLDQDWQFTKQSSDLDCQGDCLRTCSFTTYMESRRW